MFGSPCVNANATSVMCLSDKMEFVQYVCICCKLQHDQQQAQVQFLLVRQRRIVNQQIKHWQMMNHNDIHVIQE